MALSNHPFAALGAGSFICGDRQSRSIGEPRPDWLAGFGRAAPWTLIGASTVGKMHLRDNRPRDDAFACMYSGGLLAAAVADGLGSRPNSGYGAAFCVAVLCEELIAAAEADEEGDPQGGDRPLDGLAGFSLSYPPPPSPWSPAWMLRRELPQREETAGLLAPNFIGKPGSDPHEDAAERWGTMAWRRSSSQRTHSRAAQLQSAIRRAFRRTHCALSDYAAAQRVPLEELGCTLMGVVIDASTGHVAVGHVGDGLICWAHPREGARSLVDPPSTGNPGQTFTFTQPDWETRFADAAYPPEEVGGASAIFLMSDGVAEDCTHPPPQDILARWARDVEREMRSGGDAALSAQRLAQWLANYEAPGSWDDRTLVVLLRDLPCGAEGAEGSEGG